MSDLSRLRSRLQSRLQSGLQLVVVSGRVTRSAAAPLVIGAYAFFLLLMMFYLWTIWRRIGKVEADMRALERRQGAAPGSHAR